MEFMDNGGAGPGNVDFTTTGDAQVLAPEEVEDVGPDSPRTIWFRENRRMLEDKEEKEKAEKAEIQKKAEDYIQNFFAVCARMTYAANTVQPNTYCNSLRT